MFVSMNCNRRVHLTYLVPLGRKRHVYGFVTDGAKLGEVLIAATTMQTHTALYTYRPTTPKPCLSSLGATINLGRAWHHASSPDRARHDQKAGTMLTLRVNFLRWAPIMPCPPTHGKSSVDPPPTEGCHTGHSIPGTY
jgi:hypothetical protein